jgi:hypothetical protein
VTKRVDFAGGGATTQKGGVAELSVHSSRDQEVMCSEFGVGTQICSECRCSHESTITCIPSSVTSLLARSELKTVFGCCGGVTALSRSSGGVVISSRHRSGSGSGPLYKHLATQSVPPSYLNARTSICHGSLVDVQARWV